MSVSPSTPNLPSPRPPAHEPASLRGVDIAAGLGLIALAGLVVWLITGSGGGSAAQSPATPPPIVSAQTPVPGSAVATTPATAIVAAPPQNQQLEDLRRFLAQRPSHIPARWVAGFYPVYDRAARTFGINWLLLASIHKQETSFSTDASTYSGLNFAHCCGGPMQFNVTNRPVSTWSLVSDSFRYGARPVGYPHATATHPSLYDDFDSLMAAARLLAADGARLGLDGRAWEAAYDYYGHDATGVTYADQVLARAIGWSQRGFCINCGLDERIVAAVHGAYGAHAQAALR